MQQRTIITNELSELKGYMEELRGESTYTKASDRLLLIFDQEDDKKLLNEKLELIRGTMPDIKIVGVTMTEAAVMPQYRGMYHAAVYTFILFENAFADVFHYDLSTVSAEAAGRSLFDEVQKRADVAGIMLFTAGIAPEIDSFLQAFGETDIPLIGAEAGAVECPCLYSDTTDDNGLIAIAFYGESLQLYYTYDMGWKPIGKAMRVTAVEDDYTVSAIDGVPAARIYERYLGVQPDKYFVENVREFPLVKTIGERQVVRCPSGVDDEGRLSFIAKVRTGETVRLSYGNPRRLLEETRLYAESMRSFAPQAYIQIMCENRARFLGDLAASDVNSYRAFCPEMAWLRSFAAIIQDERGGGVVNSAILSVGFREAATQERHRGRTADIVPAPSASGTIPLNERLAMFLEQTTKELEEMAVAADAANAAKSEFLSQMSHEIRTPINAVLGMNEMILRESDQENVLRYADNARVAGLGLLGIINDILDFSKIEAGKMDISPSEYELSSLVNDLINLIRIRAEEKGLFLIVEVDPKLPHLLYGDEMRIKQILTNLLTNAVKYTDKGSVTMSLSFEKSGNDKIRLIASVKDTGIGIRRENIKRLFEAFDRVDPERVKRTEGTGLGLTITQKLLGLMGSTLEIESEYGRGSVFSFELTQEVRDWSEIGDYRAALEKVQNKRLIEKSHFVAPDARILVVDDAPMNLAVISGLLKRTKVMVDTALSGRECIEKFLANSYDIVFLDHRMPNMDGMETLAFLREKYPDRVKATPVVSLTANAVAGAREEYMAAGFTDYLTKPVIANDLEDMLRKYLPSEKINEIEVVPKKRIRKAEGEALPKWIEEIKALDTHAGVAFCGGVSEYMDALRIFAASVKERAAEIEEAYTAHDYENYTIKVHALKSMARSIGAAELSEMAARLEEAGESRDIERIDADTKKLLMYYRSFDMILRPIFERTILLVDDDADYLKMVSRWLSKDYVVETVGSGAEALSYLSAHHPDLILLDYAMPEMNGLEVLTQIRQNEETSDIAVIFLTGKEDPDSTKAAEKLSPDGFLLKTMGKSGLLLGITKYFESSE